MKFKSEKSLFAGLVIWGTIFLLSGILFYDFWEEGKLDMPYLYLINLPIILLMLWIWFVTHYELESTNFKYRSGPISGKIKIVNIHTVIKNKTLWSGTKISLAARGLILKYNRYDEIYMSPVNQGKFIAQLIRLNQNIIVED